MPENQHYLVPVERMKAIREAIYAILTSANDQKPPDVSLTQNNAVALTSAVKKDGVTIINNQSFTVQNITLAAIEMMRSLDDLPFANQVTEAEVREVGGPYNGATDFLEDCFDKRMSLSQVTSKAKDLYTRFVSDFYDGDEEQTRRLLGVRKTKLLSL